MFKSANGDFDIQRTHINGQGDYVITAGLSDQGILGKTDVKAKTFEAHTITIDMFGNAFYRQFRYKMVTHARVFSLKPNFELTERQNIFLSSTLFFLRYYFGYENMCSWAKIQDIKITLPTKDGAIDFAFMEDFISEIEKQPLTALENYLTVTGLKNNALTKEEKTALSDFENGKIEWALYKMDNLFRKVTTKKLPYKAANLPTEPIGENVLPCLTASFKNQGLNYFAPTKGATILKDVISLPSNSDVYRAYFQSNDFTILSDAYAIDWDYNKKHYKAELFLFIVASINRVTDLPIYSYKNKLGGWNVVKEKYIQLPTKDKKPDYNFMQNLVRAIKKLVIEEVVLYAKKKIQATKQVIK